MAISENLKRLREEKGITKQKLVDDIGIKYTTYANYESGNREPNSEALLILAKYYGVSVDSIFGSDNIIETERYSKEEETLITDYRVLQPPTQILVSDMVSTFAEYERNKPKKEQKEKALPDNVIAFPVEQEDDDSIELSIIGKAAGGTPIEIMEDACLGYVKVPSHTRADYALFIEGHSMEPKIPDGSVVLVKDQDFIDNCQIGIFYINGENTCKKYVVNDHGVAELQSLNHKYGSIVFHEYDDARVIGRVAGVKTKDDLILF